MNTDEARIRTLRHRDLSVIPLAQDTLVISCDSCGSAGAKPADALQIPPYYTGRFTARVALLEVLSCGAVPVTVVNAVSCEMQPTGSEILRGVQDELAAAGIDAGVLTGSTEENFSTQMTAVGITAVGVIAGRPRWQTPQAGDLVYCIGKPKVGAAVKLDGDPEMASYADLAALLAVDGMRDVIPTGSRGIAYEAQLAAQTGGLCFAAYKDVPLDLACSTGPASCLVAVCSAENAAVMQNMARAVPVGVLQPCSTPAE